MSNLVSKGWNWVEKLSFNEFSDQHHATLYMAKGSSITLQFEGTILNCKQNTIGN